MPARGRALVAKPTDELSKKMRDGGYASRRCISPLAGFWYPSRGRLSIAARMPRITTATAGRRPTATVGGHPPHPPLTDSCLLPRARLRPRVWAARARLELARLKATESKRFKPGLRPVEDVGGGQRPERKQLVSVAGVEDHVGVLEHVVEHRITVWRQPDHAPMQIGLPASTGSAESPQKCASAASANSRNESPATWHGFLGP